MKKPSTRREEIEALAEEVSKRRRAATDKVEAAAEEIIDDIDEAAQKATAAGERKLNDLVSVLEDLRDRLDDGVSGTRAFTASNPVTALSAAFLLGIVVGRIWRSS